jgi:hypothetical protein
MNLFGLLIVFNFVSFAYLKKKNSNCVEFKESLDRDTILQVPCKLLRLVQVLKLCPLNVYQDVFVDIRCSEKCLSGFIKKKFNRLKSSLSRAKNKDVTEFDEMKRAKKLFNFLDTSISNATDTSKNTCRTYAFALKIYLEKYQKKMSIRKRVLKASQHKQPLNENIIINKLEYFRCSNATKNDEISYFFYLKYLLGFLRNLSSAEPKSTTVNDVTQIFYPYVEMTNKFDRILPTQSYLLYLLENFNTIFSKTSCKSKDFKDTNMSENDTDKLNLTDEEKT